MNSIKAAFTWLALAVGVLLSVVFLAFFFNGLDLSIFKFFAPKVEQVRRDTFEQSQSYNEGMRRDLENIRNQYLSATDPAAKDALAATFKHRAEGYPNQLPYDLQAFYNSLK